MLQIQPDAPLDVPHIAPPAPGNALDVPHRERYSNSIV